MMLSVMVVGAGAAFSDQSKIKNTEAVDACTALNIIGGYPDGSFKPEGNITRAEVTKMICVALNGGKNPAVSTNTTPTFSDVRNNANAAWAEGYIESCAAQGIVSGVGGGKFAPNGNVTGVQLAKMLLVSLGYKSENEGFTGNAWATNVNVRAAQKGLYEGLEKMDTNAAITRDNAAQMVWNALNAYEVEYKTTLVTDSKGQLTSQITVQDKVVGSTNDKITLLEDKYDAVTDKGILTSVKYNDNDKTYTTQVKGVTYDVTNSKGEDISIGALDATADYSALMGQEVKVMYTVDNKSNDITLLGIYATSKNKTVTALGDDIDYSKTNKVEINNKDYELATITDKGTKKLALKVVAPNGDDASYAETTKVAGKIINDNDVDVVDYYNYTLVDNNNDKAYEYAVVTPFAVAQIDYLTSSKLTLSPVGGTDSILTDRTFDLKNDDVNLYKDAAEDDYVVVTPAAYSVSGYTEITKADIVSGKVDATKTDSNSKVTDVKVAGTWYSLSDKNNTGDPIKLNDSYNFAVVNGFAFNAEKTKGDVSAENVLFVEKHGALKSGISDGVEAKVWFSDGSSKTITVTAYTAAPGDKKGDTDMTVGDTYDIVAGTPASDEIQNDTAATLIKNDALYTYSEKNGEYTLEPLYDTNGNNDNKGSYDKYVTETTGTIKIKDGKTTGKARFADDGVIFVHDKDGVKVITGKTVTNWKETTVTSVAGLADKTSGVYYIAVGAINMKSTTAKSDAAAYGFITSAISTSKEGSTTYNLFTMWDGTKSVDVKVDKNDVKVNLAKYSFVSFDWEVEPAGETAGEADGTSLIVKTAAKNATAITAFVNNDSITFSDGTSLDFADTYFVIGVDTKAGEGSSAKLATAKDKPADATKLCANAVYFIVKDGDDYVVEAVFVDAAGVMSKTDKADNEIYVPKTMKDVIAAAVDNKESAAFKGIEEFASVDASATVVDKTIVITGTAKDIASAKKVPGFTTGDATMTSTYKGNTTYPNVSSSDKFAIVYVKDLDLLLLVGDKEANNSVTKVDGTNYTIDLSGLKW